MTAAERSKLAASPAARLRTRLMHSFEIDRRTRERKPQRRLSDFSGSSDSSGCQNIHSFGTVIDGPGLCWQVGFETDTEQNLSRNWHVGGQLVTVRSIASV